MLISSLLSQCLNCSTIPEYNAYIAAFLLLPIPRCFLFKRFSVLLI